MANRRTFLMVAIVVGVALFLVALFELPERVINPKGTISAADRLAAENDVRTTMLQAVGGLALLLGLYFTGRTFRLNRESQVTERFTRAIDQLGNQASLDVRLGGIYALERIARDSERDHWPIMEILTAFIRERASVNRAGTTGSAAETSTPTPTAHDDERKQEQSRDPAAPNGVETEPRPPVDIQAALTVIGRRLSGRETLGQYLDLSETDLRGARLHGDFARARFIRTNLEHARLAEASLKNAFLTEARLKGSSLSHADLSGAFLDRADLERAVLTRARLEDAILHGAFLTGAQLDGVEAARADFHGAFLFDASLSGADLRGANLRDASFEGAFVASAKVEGASFSKRTRFDNAIGVPYEADRAIKALPPDDRDLFGDLPEAPPEGD